MQVLSLEESGLPECQSAPLCLVVRSSLPLLTSLNLGGHHWGRDCLVECLRILLGSGVGASSSSSSSSSVLSSLVLPIYGLKDLMFRFKDRFESGVGQVGDRCII